MRTDIQCLRGLAITSVLLYHLSPSLFVNGFLGVDVFFVISGYLMARNLTDHPLHGVTDIFQFYYRRLKRILPLYYLVILVTVVLAHFLLGPYVLNANRIYSLVSLFLVTNQLVIHDSRDYFSNYILDGSSRNAFLHLWSLGVEIQFYLLVPILFIGLQLLKYDVLRLTASLITTLSVFITFNLVNYHFAFNFMFLRLWQFSAGFIALYWIQLNKLPTQEDKKEADKHKNINFLSIKENLIIIAVALISLSVAPWKVDVQVLRPLVTASTALVIAIGGQGNKILTSKTFSYLGDISYVVYLVHWPVICLFPGSSPKSIFLCIFLTFFTSILIHHLYEKVYLKLNKPSIILLVLALIGSNAALQYSIRSHEFWIQKLPEDVEKVVEENSEFLKSAYVRRPFGEEECYAENDEWMGPEVRANLFRNCLLKKGTGNTSISVIGNSYALNLVGGLHDKFAKNYSDFRLLSVGGCSGLNAFNPAAKNIMKYYHHHVETHKPDVLVIMNRHGFEYNAAITSDKDSIIEEINENIKFYEKFVKRIYILGSHPKYPMNFLSLFLDKVTQKNPDDVQDLYMDRRKADYFMRNTRKRFSRIRCSGTCEVFSLGRAFLDGDRYLTFDIDRMVSYVDNDIHFTPPGIQKMGGTMKELVGRILS